MRIADRRPPIHFLRAWRRERRLTQQQLGERAGISHGTISRLENGVINLTRDSAVKLAASLLVQVSDLFRDPRDPRGVWGLASKIDALPEDQKRLVETIINSFLKDANGQP